MMQTIKLLFGYVWGIYIVEVYIYRIAEFYLYLLMKAKKKKKKKKKKKN